MKLSELNLPATIEYTCGPFTNRARIVRKAGLNLQTEQGHWLWWPTVNHYDDVRVVDDNHKPTFEELFQPR